MFSSLENIQNNFQRSLVIVTLTYRDILQILFNIDIDINYKIIIKIDINIKLILNIKLLLFNHFPGSNYLFETSKRT